MLFPTAEYGIFFLCIFAGAWALHRRLMPHKLFLLAASYAFYGFWDARFVPLLAGISLHATLVGRGLQSIQRPDRRKALLAVGVAGALAPLVGFKYLGFLTVAFLELLRLVGLRLELTPPELPLPVGISFFAFHAISLMVDSYRGHLSVRVKVVDALLYVAFFPQLVAGPILRAHDFLPQLARPPDPRSIDAARALELIVIGLVKKVLLASFFATRLVDPVFEAPAEHNGLEVALAVYGYAAQIYCDFSGYTDLAIGSALLLGYRLPENFRAPYLATSPQDFWRRWHVSLSSWLRDYLFIPLGGSRRGPWRTLTSLVITMVLGGLWHGAAPTFVVWGAIHAGGLVAHRLFATWRTPLLERLRQLPAYRALCIVLTFHFVCLGWMLFRSTSLEAAAELFAALASSVPSPSTAQLAAAALVLLALLSQALPAAGRESLRARFARLPLTAQGLAFALALLLLDAMGPQGVAPFIYFQF